MPKVQFSCPPAQINITRYMNTPKGAGNIGNWLREARKVVPQIPNIAQSDWYIHDHQASLRSIIFELRDSVGNKCAVCIERRANRMLSAR